MQWKSLRRSRRVAVATENAWIMCENCWNSCGKCAPRKCIRVKHKSRLWAKPEITTKRNRKQKERESERAITRNESWARLCVQRNKRKVWFKIEVKKINCFFLSLKNVNNKNKQYNYTHTHKQKRAKHPETESEREKTWTSSRLVALFDRC